MNQSVFLPRITGLGNTAWQYFMDYLAPPRCLICQAYGRWLCRTCNLQFGPRPAQTCPGCGTSDLNFSRDGLTCPECRALASPLDQLLSAFAYESKIFHRVLAGLKENGNSDLAPFLTGRFSDQCVNLLDLHHEPLRPITLNKAHRQAAQNKQVMTRSNVIIPIPASPRRLRLRGFNQSAILARALAERLGLPMREDILYRHNNNQSQKNLNRATRRLRLKQVFFVKNNHVLKGMTVILVDDVATTLATLETCAQLLKARGTARVLGCVLSRAR